ncbi:ATP-binding cassette domain-containing protein [Ochrobactrum pecoris]|uniref:ATP-binding cassette domain-containing protein n=1 Tax=Brucella pecoris TaxID=867683 RepID=A0A5C5CCM9_9HYPH|nr:ATP-binding cassette domain-containing protein [Brucella pecoris]MBB4096261.1 ribose transport system ATP-binding protein [Brucella pecoris]NKW81558.1 ATP-binding cassette domain-containing protein [Brucella pecoris]TNV08695.1 ATP-binding cassette domain-containing protein [Brucella pecoris]
MVPHQTGKPAGSASAPALECRSIRKIFPGVTALSDVSLSIRKGEIHALLGQNGAGKSTLVKVLTGVYQTDGGEIFVDGNPVRMRSAVDAEANGITIVHQDQQLVAQFDVTQNIFLGHEKLSGGFLDKRAMAAVAETALERVGAAFTPDTLVRDLSVAQREQVSIAAALLRDPKILILDEPTASLSEKEAELLFTMIRSLRDQGVTIIYISHYLDEVLDLVDRITVLRDGRLVETRDALGTSRSDIVQLMVGRDISQLYPKEALPLGEVLIEVRGLQQGQAVRGVDFSVRRGEIFGIAGLMGAGRSELAMALIGALPRSAGEVILRGQVSAPANPGAARREGFAIIPEDRRHEGLLTGMTMRENLTLPNIGLWSRGGLIDLRREKADAASIVRNLNIQPPVLNHLARNLSGGNQQKVVIGRWLPGDSEVFLFDEPTTGVDVGSKVEIYRQMIELARRGAAVIFISSDFEEVAGMCDRVAVMHKGRINAVLEGQNSNPETMLYWASGSNEKEQHMPATPATQRGHMRPETQKPTKTTVTRWSTLGGMALVLAVITLLAPNFLSIGNVFDVLKQGSVLAFIALGLTIVLVAGGFDMSAGAASQLTTNIASGLLIGGTGMIGAIGMGLATGAAIGVVNAMLVLFFGMPAFVASLGTMFVTMGATLLYNGGQALTLSNEPAFFFIGQGYVGPVPFVFILLLVVAVLLHLLLRHTRLGLRMYAIGQNLEAAELRGVARSPYAFASFVIGGLVLGLAGVVLASYSYGASALATGIDFLISALAAAFLGSALSRAGDLSVTGTVITALFLASLSNGLVLIGVSSQLLPAIQGLVLILSIALGVFRRREIGQVLIF